MNASKHTEGHWTIRKENSVSAEFVESGETQIAMLCDGDDEERMANARLISAAPDMLAALNSLVGLIQLVRSRSDCPAEINSVLTYHWRLTEAQEAIAKAEAAS